MHTTISLDEDLLREAGRLTGISQRSALVQAAFRQLIERERASTCATGWERTGAAARRLEP